MVIFDTSGSMTTAVNASNSCGYPNDRLGHGRCALKNTLLAYAGEANFGLASYARVMTGCSGAQNPCNFGANNNNCTFANDSSCNSAGNCATNDPGCGWEPNADSSSSTRHGANILVPMLQDNYWTSPPVPTNVSELVSYVDNDCTGGKELFADGCTPINGALRDMFRYYSSSWTQGCGALTYPSPLDDNERGCRSVNVLLITDGDETCDTQANAVDAAADLFTGFTKGSLTWHVKTYVINFAGGTTTNTDQIAAAGGTVKSYPATDEATLSEAIASIISGSIKPESCNNADDNCNGCTDEGFKHYCDIQQTCCVWSTPTQRSTCLANYQASITPSTPGGNVTLLPCTTVAQQAEPANWLCYDPKDICDNVDNDCNGVIDEGSLKCGNPPHCPQTEICNGQDDNCNGQIDEGCPTPCIPSPEVCDGCDNDCDGIADNGVAAVPCGLPSPPNCVGTMACKPAQPVAYPGACVTQNGGFGTCNNAPQAEICDGLDNNCNGLVDDGIAPIACVPPGTPAGLVYKDATHPNSQCQMGTQPCNGTCTGFVGPSAEVCDGIDNDCNGIVDDNVPQVGQPCGINQPPCTPGVTACVGGALVCQGGVGPKPEVCNGVDDNCNGQVDEAPLADAPMAGQNGCWPDPATCATPCSYPNPAGVNPPTLTWCAPAGATCNGNGTLTAPCNKGTLVCGGTSGWLCQGAKEPSPEVCDGLDNNCNGQVDEGPIPQVGLPCGTDVGECQLGALACSGGALTCVGSVGPTQEICDGKDNDCDGTVDNGIPLGAPCWQPYDTTLYPGNRTSPPCQPGQLKCDGMGGLICVGGVGPSPEICDNIDNDCDGLVDEDGTPPDGVTGLANPADPTQHVGDACDVPQMQGVCQNGNIACLNGTFLCLNGKGPTPEVCDCNDNNCDGVVDNQDPNAPAICSPGKDCVKTSNGCQCAGPCSGGEIPCPTGQLCQKVTSSETGQDLGSYCVVDPCAGGCDKQTDKDAQGNIVCGPEGTMISACVPAPLCVCKGQVGCKEPCLNVTCPSGKVCAKYGPLAGTCVADNNCYAIGCNSCDEWCNLGVCETNPCQPNPCTAPNDVCKPKATGAGDGGMAYDCVGSCADVTCNTGEVCLNGKCVTDCPSACPAGQICDVLQQPPICVANQCQAADGGVTACANDGCCDPITGLCGNCPCDGVVCPSGQTCKGGDCFAATTTSSSSGTGGTGSGGMSTSTASGSGNAAANGGSDKGVWGLATGGGGCACEMGGAPASRLTWAAWLALAITVLRRRRRDQGEPRRTANKGVTR